MFKCSNAQMLKCSNVQMFKCSNAQMFKSSNVRYQIPNVNKVKLLSECTSEVPPIIFDIVLQSRLCLSRMCRSRHHQRQNSVYSLKKLFQIKMHIAQAKIRFGYKDISALQHVKFQLVRFSASPRFSSLTYFHFFLNELYSI